MTSPRSQSWLREEQGPSHLSLPTRVGNIVHTALWSRFLEEFPLVLRYQLNPYWVILESNQVTSLRYNPLRHWLQGIAVS